MYNVTDANLSACADVQAPFEIRISDISMVFAVRLHEGNGWIVERLRRMADYYRPCPEIHVVDFGSEEPFAGVVEALCADRGYRYLRVEDSGVFSLAAARNAGFENTTTEFVFFCDPDFISERRFFERLVDAANALNMRNVIDIMINPPAYHLNQKDTEEFEAAANYDEKSRHLLQLSFAKNYSAYEIGGDAFVAPYSNVFMVNRKMFSLCGGYDSGFRGHGSEDFEFLLRCNMHSMLLPMPSDPSKDCYGPGKADFFSHKKYVGFRSQLALLSQPAENLGFKVFHLHHERTRSSDWYQNNDWKRKNFQTAVDAYIKAPHNLLATDFLTRSKTMVCVCKNLESWGFFLPLRELGYRLLPVFNDEPETVSDLVAKLMAEEVDGVAIFNPYMKSHAAFKEVVMLARELGRKVVVIERGALPSSIYYSDDVSYVSESYSEQAFLAEPFNSAELDMAAGYVRELRAGDKTLESMDSYATTLTRHRALPELKKTICFVPLQLEDDMAVTLFVKGKQNYRSFLDSLPELIASNPDILFVVKPHPLSKIDNLRPATNLIVAQREDNIHFLVDAASFTLCYNSGVGLLSILHEKPTVTLGNAFYNMAGAGYAADSAEDGIRAFKAGQVQAPDSALVHRIAAWFWLRKYSLFSAVDSIREFKDRKAHNYNSITVTRFRLDDVDLRLERVRDAFPFSWSSFAANRAGFFPDGGRPKALSTDPKKKIDARESSGRQEFHNGQYAKAGELFLKAYDDERSNVRLLRSAAEAFYRAGDRQRALRILKNAQALQPTNRRILARRGIMLMPPFVAWRNLFQWKVQKS